uniref:DUF1403 family protein n=1 Tax=Chelativorans sp. (strain BNC1) TaxID=266779 RepID=Q11AK2_CHESB
MILRLNPSSRHRGTPPGSAAAVPLTAVPAWLRSAVPGAQSVAGNGVEDVALAAGAALGTLDAVVRRQERWAGAWRQRLALAAAAATTKQAGRLEDEAALRDALLLTKGADDVGPGGQMLWAWRRLTAQPSAELLTAKTLAAVLQDFGHARDDAAVSGLADELRQLAGNSGTLGVLTGALMAAERHCFGRLLGAWLADAVLAQRLGWAHAIPLLGAEPAFSAGAARSRRARAGVAVMGGEKGPHATTNLLAAQARAALRAIDLSSELGRRADRLLAVAPKLRAKGADAIVDRFLNEDALVASRGDRDKHTGMSDRGLRRLFDRLVALGAVRELSGRPTFRIYGL